MRRWGTVLFTALIFLAIASCFPAAHADEPPSQIISIDYPKTVIARAHFVVTLQVAYSSKFGMIDIGIWDLVRGIVIQSLVSNQTLLGAGRSTFNFNLTAPSTIGAWKLTAIARVWLQDAWFFDQAGKYDFAVGVVEDGILILSDAPQGSAVLVDGEQLRVNDSAFVVPLALGVVHTLEVAPVISEKQGTRIVFESWSDGIRSNPRILVLNSSLNISPRYMTQYYLNVRSDFGTGVGEGWYARDEVAQFGLTTTRQEFPVSLSFLTDTYVFGSWSGDTVSNLPDGTVRMDGPKSVAAKWVHSGTSLSLNGISIIILFGAILLGITPRLKVRGHRGRRGTRSGASAILVLLLALSVAFYASPHVYGQLPSPSAASVVNIGDAYWYYWSQPGSDTCILWLGGGVEYSQGGYLINPYEYESFGTIKFLQDLAKYYCVVALEKGPNPSPASENRTIYQELAQGQFSVATQLHQWINAQGYKHIFLIGYSVGTDVAALVATGNPQTWGGSDGLILITAWLSPGMISGAPKLKANLLLLYGHAPNFEPTGLTFYQEAPSEGWHASAYFHKEFHLLDEMGHEVWSPLNNNTYNSTALAITVNFIEKSKTLQIGQFTPPNLPSNGIWTYHLSRILLPSTVFWGEPFIINASISSGNATTGSGAVVAYNSSSILALAEFNGGFSATNVRLVMPSVANSSESSFSLITLQKNASAWQLASPAYPLTVSATGRIGLVVDGLIPDSALIFDGINYPVSSTGQVKIDTSKGIHFIEVQANIIENHTRGDFIQWSDSNTSSSRSLQLEGNTSLTAVYRVQYYVDVVSQFGSTQGAGWYDVNSTVEPSIQTLMDGQRSQAFSYWNSGDQTYGLGEPIRISSPMTIEAVWTHTEQTSVVDRAAIVLLAASLFIFAVMLILNLKLVRKPSEGDRHV